MWNLFMGEYILFLWAPPQKFFLFPTFSPQPNTLKHTFLFHFHLLHLFLSKIYLKKHMLKAFAQRLIISLKSYIIYLCISFLNINTVFGTQVRLFIFFLSRPIIWQYKKHKRKRDKKAYILFSEDIKNWN